MQLAAGWQVAACARALGCLFPPIILSV